jgi:tetratricopeptide (TPR) repeat protein
MIDLYLNDDDRKDAASLNPLQALVPVFLLAAILAIYWQVTDYGFINYRDNSFIIDNLYVRNGLSVKGTAWSLETSSQGGWRPLIWLSHMLDCELYGLNPGLHHLTNFLFHATNVCLLFFILKRMTGTLWRSAFVTAVFAVHPLNVEPVAWVAERRVVLSAFFWLLILWSYVHYVGRAGLARYLLCFALFILGLMTGPLVFSLPFLFLILDYWPLRRWGLCLNADVSVSQERPIRRCSLLWEKVPFFTFMAFFGTMAFLALGQEENSPIEVLPLQDRLTRIPVSYVACLGKVLKPDQLAVVYSSPDTPTIWLATGAGVLVLGISILAIRLLRRIPYLALGWFWYLTTLTPIVAFGETDTWPVAADNFTYVPIIGLFIIMAWGFADMGKGMSYRRIVLAFGAGVVLSSLMVLAWSQTRHWQNSLTLFGHAVKVSPKNPIARNQLGFALACQGRYPDAMSHLTEAIRLKTDYAEAHDNLGLVLYEQGRFQEAVGHFSEALRIDPRYAKAHARWAQALTRSGLFQEAIKHYLEALKINPEDAEAHNNLGVTLFGQGRLKEALYHYSAALRIRPDYGDAKKNRFVLLRSINQSQNAGNTTKITP